ncbi:MAG: beta-lactamase family protein [Methanomicrobiales archaeon]|nr:beta-lactamase family protein [Methanomicrobiales archaeon]
MVTTGDITTTVERMVVNAFPDDTAPGAAVLLSKKGQILYRRGIGQANLEHLVPLKPDMPFQLASLTKPFTSTAILMLVESGQLALTDPLDHLLPEFPMGETTITLEHLLTHTSGIAEYTELPEWWAMHRQDVTIDQLIDLFKISPRTFAPGTRWSYCNSGYILLGVIIERITGTCYADFLAEHVFTPLNMSSTSYKSTHSLIIPHLVNGYSQTPQGYRPAEYFSSTHFYSAGGLISTLEDLTRWFTALSTGNLLSLETLRRMWTPYTLADGRSTRYGYGWWLSEYHGQSVVEHYGSLPGCANYMLARPEDDVLVIILSNNDGNLNRVEQLTIEMAALILGKPYQPPATFPLSSAELSRFAGTYLTEEGMQLTVIPEEGQLTLQTSAGDRFSLAPQSPWEFLFPEIPESRLVFLAKEEVVTGLDWLPRRGVPVQARKIVSS